MIQCLGGCIAFISLIQIYGVSLSSVFCMDPRAEGQSGLSIVGTVFRQSSEKYFANRRKWLIFLLGMRII